MARNNKEKNKKKPFFFRKWVIGLATALGISVAGLGVHEMVSRYEDKQLEKGIDGEELPKEINEEYKDTSKDDEVVIKKEKEEKENKEKIKKEDKADEVKEEKEFKEPVSNSSKDKSLKEENINNIYVGDLIIPIIKDFKTNSIIDALNDVGYDSSLTSRARLAVYFNIVNSEEEFGGLAIQNTTLLECLREYARNLQNSVHDDYAKVLDDTALKNSVPDTNSPSYGDNTSDNGNENNNDDEKDKDKDDDKKKPQKDKHKWGPWLPLDDDYEHRYRDDGKEEKQLHPSYGEWSDNGDDTKSRTCGNCNHIEKKPYVWGEWLSINDDYEHRFREDGKEDKQLHPFGEFIDNGDGTETKTCPNCGHKVTKKIEEEHQHNCIKQAPVSLNATDEENCQAIYFKCPDDDYIDESLTEYVPHDLPDTPEDVLGDEGLFRCNTCGMEIIKEIEKPPHEHHPEEQAPVSLNKTDKENCAVIYHKCPDDDYIDESLTEYVPHDLPDTPEDVLGDEGLFTCRTCGMQIIKKITGTVEEVNEEPDDLTVDFDPSSFNNEEYEFMDEEESSLEQVEIINNEEEKEEEKLDDDNVLLLEDKSAKPLIEDQQKDLETVLNTFDTELYKNLFKKKQILEQFASKGIKSDETLNLLRYIDVIKSNMVQELANALVKEDLKNLEQGRPFTFKI